jgi:enoyl-CoA hydratase
MTETDELLHEVDEAGIARITLNPSWSSSSVSVMAGASGWASAPEPKHHSPGRSPVERNALTFAMYERLHGLAEAIDADPAVRAVVIQGAGVDLVEQFVGLGHGGRIRVGFCARA